MRTTALDAMNDEDLSAILSSEDQKHIDAIVEAKARRIELSPGELRLMKIMDDAVDHFYRVDLDRKKKHLDQYLQFIAERKDDILLLTWIYEHAGEMYRWLERIERPLDMTPEPAV